MGDAHTANAKEYDSIMGRKFSPSIKYFIKKKIADETARNWIHGRSIISATKTYREDWRHSSDRVRLQYCCDTIVVRQRRSRRRPRKSSCCLNRTEFSACICICVACTHTARERVKAVAKLCYRLEFNSPLFVFLFILHISFGRIAMVLHSSGVWFSVGRSMLQQHVFRNAVFVCDANSCMCVVEEVEKKE